MTTNSLNQQMKLSDGRLLGYNEYGDPNGKPVIVCHGFPGSRLDGALISDTAAMEASARIITPDRPGLGLSDAQKNRRLLDWPSDVVELADALKLDKLAVLGISGGGPYAATCAAKIPHRLSAAGIVCGMGPADAPGVKDGTSWTFPGQPAFLRRLTLSIMAFGLRKSYARFAENMAASFAGPDAQLIINQPELIDDMMASFLEAFCSGAGGVNHEAQLYTKPWGFDLQSIRSDVLLWHGAQDGNVSVSVGRHVAEALPNCRASFFENEGHLTLIKNRSEDILRQLLRGDEASAHSR